MKKKILIVDNSLGITGAFNAIFYMANSLCHKYDFYFSIPPASEQLIKMIAERKFPVLLIDFFELRKSISVLVYFPMLIINSLRLALYCRREKITIVHVNDLYNMTGLVIKIVRPSTRVIYHIRLLSTSYGKIMYKLWTRIIDRFADRIIVVSEAVRSDIEKYVRKSKVELIYDFIALKEEYVTELNDSAVVRFLYPANYVQGKGHEFAIRAFSQAFTSDSRIRLTFAGGDFGRPLNSDYRKKLQMDVVELSLCGYVDFQDTSDDIEKLMKNHDVILNFSESESFSMTCYEALYYGRPVIATNSGGPAELIEHNVTGLLVPNRDVPAMTEALLVLARSREKRESFGKRGKEILKARVTTSNPSVKTSKIYQGL